MRKALLNVAVVLILLPLAGGCRKDSGPKKDGGPALTALTVSPADMVVELELATPGSQAFTATGSFDDGSTADVTADVSWSASNPAVGTLSGALLEIPGFASVGVAGSTITASLGDLEDEAYLTVVALGTADVLFVVPHLAPGGSLERDVSFVAHRVPSADVFFLIDATGSMGGEIGNFQSGLTGTIVPGIRAEIADTQFGVGAVQDFPVDPYGSVSASAECGAGENAADQPFKLRQAMTDSIVATQAAFGSLTVAGGAPIGCGNDWPESHIEALYQMATGEGLGAPSPTVVPAASVGFREAASHVVVLASDALSHAPGETTACTIDASTADYGGTVAAVAHTRAQAKTALAQTCARVIGVSSDPGSGTAACRADADLEDFATTTGARVPPSAWDVPARPAGCSATQCCTGVNGVGIAADGDGLCPLVFRVTGTGAGLGNNVVGGFGLLTRYAGLDVSVAALGETGSLSGTALPGAATTADFIDAMAPSAFVTPAGPPVLPDPTLDAAQFYGAAPDTELTFAVTAFNDVVASGSEPQLFRAKAQITGGCSVLDERALLFLVPRAP